MADFVICFCDLIGLQGASKSYAGYGDSRLRYNRVDGENWIQVPWQNVPVNLPN